MVLRCIDSLVKIEILTLTQVGVCVLQNAVRRKLFTRPAIGGFRKGGLLPSPNCTGLQGPEEQGMVAGG